MCSILDVLFQILIKNPLSSNQKIQLIEYFFQRNENIEYVNNQYVAYDIEFTEDDVIYHQINAVNLKRSNGNTLLFWAVKDEDYVLLDWLLAHGADINQRNFQNKSVLHEAIDHGYFQVFDYLLTKGANCQYEHLKHAQLMLRLIQVQTHINLSQYLGLQNILQHFERFPITYASFIKYHLQQRDPETIRFTRLYIWRMIYTYRILRGVFSRLSSNEIIKIFAYLYNSSQKIPEDIFYQSELSKRTLIDDCDVQPYQNLMERYFR